MKKALARLASRCDTALLTLLVGFSFSMAANLLWTWEGGPVRILGGALASLALPGAVHLWPRIPLPAPLQVPVIKWRLQVPVMRIVRALAMTGIAAMAAFTTFSHASSLLVEHGETPLLATLYPVMTELLVVMGVLARHTPQSQGERAPRKPAVKVRAESSVGAATSPPVAPTEPTDNAAKAWARKNWPVTAKEIELGAQVSKSYSFKVRDAVRAEMEAAS